MIRCESELAMGSEFRILLPIEKRIAVERVNSNE